MIASKLTIVPTGLLLCALLAPGAVSLGAGAAWASDSADKAAAAACREFRLDAGGSMSHVTVVDQPEHLCWSYNYAQLVDAWRFSHGEQPPREGYEARTSGFELAVAYAAAHGGARYQDVFQNRSIEELDVFVRKNQHRLCDDRAIARENSSRLPDKAFAEKLLEYWAQYGSKLGSARKDNSELYRRDPELFMIATGARIARQMKCERFGGDMIRTPQLALFIRDTRPVSFLNGIFNAICQGHELSTAGMPALTVERYVSHRETMIAHRIEEIAGGPRGQPVSLNFCGNILEDPGYRGYRFYDYAKDCKKHFALVVAQRWNRKDQVCEVQIQNSRGPNCDPAFAKHWRCDTGKYWVDRDAIYANTQYLNFFQP